MGNITSDSVGIYVANEGSVTAHGDVEAKGTGIQNEGGTVNVDGNVNEFYEETDDESNNKSRGINIKALKKAIEDKASTDDTTNSPVRMMIILLASFGVLVIGGTKFLAKEK